MIKPRNTLVVLRLIENPAKRVGKLVIPNFEENYTEAEVMAVGPGCIAAEGGRSETFDLKLGQRVLVKHKNRRGPNMPLELQGIRYVWNDEVLHIFEHSSIVGILAEPGEFAPSEPEPVKSKLALMN